MNFNHNVGAGSKIIAFFSSIISSLLGFFANLHSAFIKLSLREKIIFFVSLVVLLALIGIKANNMYSKNTILVANQGGEYNEVIYGSAKYFTPVLAKSDPERTISHIVYSALIKIDNNNVPQPDLASSWEISADGLVYTFYLRPGVFFHKGQALTSADVAATVEAIKDENNKSPLRDIWSNVAVETPDDATVIFKLPKQYGPFIYACNLEIINRDDAKAGSLTTSYNGTGPYKFLQATPEGNGDLSVSLTANDGYYAGPPYISSLKFTVVSKIPTTSALQQDFSAATAYSGFKTDAPFLDVSFATGRGLVMFFNLRSTALKDANLRKQIVANEKSTSSVKLSLVALDAEPQRSRAQEFAASHKDNFNIILRILNANDYAEAIKKRDYDLLMYGYDWSYDKDPYAFWHSTQIDKDNFDGYSDKASDILIEDARMVSDYVERNKRYDTFYQSIKDDAYAIYYDAEQNPFYISPDIKGFQKFDHAGRPEDRFNNILEWYIKEKRVRK